MAAMTSACRSLLHMQQRPPVPASPPSASDVIIRYSSRFIVHSGMSCHEVNLFLNAAISFCQFRATLWRNLFSLSVGLKDFFTIAQNPLDTLPRSFPVDGEVANLLRTCHVNIVCCVANKSATSWKQVVVMEFGNVTRRNRHNGLLPAPNCY